MAKKNRYSDIHDIREWSTLEIDIQFDTEIKQQKLTKAKANGVANTAIALKKVQACASNKDAIKTRCDNLIDKMISDLESNFTK